MEILNKITIRGIMGAEIKTFLGEQESVVLCRILGYATSEEKGDRPTQYGDNIWLNGNFKVQNLITKEMHTAPKLYCPELMHNIIANQLKIEGTEQVYFAFDIGIKKSKITIGYEYSVKSLIEPKEENDPFAALEHQIKALKLEGPASAT